MRLYILFKAKEGINMKHVLIKRISAIAIVLLLIPTLAMAQEYRYIPAGTQMVLRLGTPISTRSSQPGDPFTARIVLPERFDGGIVRGHAGH